MYGNKIYTMKMSVIQVFQMYRIHNFRPIIPRQMALK